MPSQCRVPVQTAVDLLVESFHSFCGSKVPVSSHIIYKELATKTKDLWDHKTWYLNVSQNRREILTQARNKVGLAQSEFPQEETSPTDDADDLESESSLSDGVDSEDEHDEVWFDLYLDRDEWTAIKPLENDEKRTDNTLRPGVWTNIISIAMWKQWRLPCAFVFKSGAVNVSENRMHYIIIKGHCSSKECGNKFRGYVDKEPPVSLKELLIRVKTRDTTMDTHENVRRPLNGPRRKQIGRAAVAEGGASNVKKRLARENLKRGDIGGPNEPSLDVLRHAKKESVAEDLGTNRVKGEDMIQTIERMKYEQEFMGSILDTGYSPFFIFYGTSEQKSAYKQYRHMHKKNSTISIDSTGTVVKKLKRPLKLESAHIFLYTIMIHFDKSSISVFQMLSESQEAEKIEFWLRTWQRTVDYQKPTEVVIDGSKALRAACCRALNDLHIKRYNEICFQAVSAGQQVPRNLISTFIRLDTSHFIHVWCRLDCLNNHPVRQVRDFYIRLIAIMMDCQYFHDFIEVFILTCILSLQEFDDSTLEQKSTQQSVQTTADARVKLEDMIKKRPVDVDEFLKILELPDEEFIPPTVDAEEVCSDATNFFKYLYEEAAKVKSEGTRPNFYRLPAFAEKLNEYARIFPLWTSACLPYYAEHATSSYNERGFREIKREMCKKYSLPQDTDNFLRIHLRDLIGGSKNFSGKMLDLRAQAKKVPEPKMKHSSPRAKTKQPYTQEIHDNDSDEGTEENWRNKAASYLRFKAPDLDATEYSVLEPDSFGEDSEKKFEKSHSDSRIDIESINSSNSSNPQNSPASEKTLIKDRASPTTDLSTPRNSSQPLTESQSPISNLPENLKKITEQDPKNYSHTAIHNLSKSEKTSDASTPETSSALSPSKSVNEGAEFYLPETPSPILIESNDRVRGGKSTYSRVKKPSKSKFFMSCPEAVLNLDENFEINSKKRTLRNATRHRNFLLRNATHCGTYKINGMIYFMRRTCAFDSLTSILVTAALDDGVYRSFMEQAYTDVLSFIIKFEGTGANAELYKERFLLLKPLYEKTQSVTGVNDVTFITSYDATDNPTDLWVKLFEVTPSTFHSSVCDAGVCDGDEEHKDTIQIDHSKILQRGYQCLQKALDFHPIIYRKKCECGLTCTETSVGNHHIYVELGSRSDHRLPPKTVELDVIPHELQLDSKYRLVGIINERADHFTAFCRRAQGHWQEYDDLRSSVRSCKTTEKVCPIGAIYIKSGVEKYP